MSKYINANMAMKAIEHWARYVCGDDRVPIEDIRIILDRMSAEGLGFELTYGQKETILRCRGCGDEERVPGMVGADESRKMACKACGGSR